MLPQKGRGMAYQTKMFLRMCLPAWGIVVSVMLLATVAGALTDLPRALGGQPVWPGLGDALALGGLVLAFATYLAAVWRFRRWERGEGDRCFVCTCLLGREREGRFGPYRKCLGCGKNHALGRI
jgi:hypothetical protein